MKTEQNGHDATDINVEAEVEGTGKTLWAAPVCKEIKISKITAAGGPGSSDGGTLS